METNVYLMTTMGQTPRVLLLVETSTAWSRQIVRGVAEFIRLHGPWSLTFEPRGRYEELLIPHGWTGDGVIARVTSSRLHRQLNRRRLPAVNVSWHSYRSPTMARCILDEWACADLAVKHFADRGFRQVGYLPSSERPDHSDPLGPAFFQRATERGLKWHQHQIRGGESQEQRLQSIRKWLLKLEKPIGVFAFSDIQGRLLLDACKALKIRVPDEVAVLGRVYDENMSVVSDPPLSSLEPPPLRFGFEAAKLLQNMMNGGPCPGEPIRIEPLGIVTRRSTDTFAVDDPVVAEVIRFIHAHFRKPIQVIDFLGVAGLSRRALELRFRSSLGRSPSAELRRVRLLHAQQLIADTDNPVAKIAIDSGFSQSDVFIRAFHREFGMSPLGFRRRRQLN